MNIRSHLRVNLSEGYFLEFRSEESLFRGVRLLNVGCGGCCFEWDPDRGEAPQTGAILEEVVLCNEALPTRPQRAQVIWVMGGHSEGPTRSSRDRRMLVGLKFLRPAPEFQIRIYEFFAAQLGFQVVA